MFKIINQIPKNLLFDELVKIENLKILDKNNLNFIQELSKSILNEKSLKRSPQMVALGFWLRQGNIKSIIKNNFLTSKTSFLKPKGLVFHVTPSNVDTIFIYSWIISLLCGNKNIIRISSKNKSNEYIKLFDIVEKLFDDKKWEEISKRNIFVNYEHNDELNNYFSSKCHVRILWGGNQTINKFRNYKLNPYASEICFANKLSLSVLEANSILNLSNDDIKKLTRKFINDSYAFDQKACSSPRLLAWHGKRDKISIAKNIFWKNIKEELDKLNFEFNESDSFNKLLASNSLSIDLDKTKIIDCDPRYTRVEIFKPYLSEKHLYGKGLFLELSIEKLKELDPIFNKAIQTISYFGFNKEFLTDFIKSSNFEGIDRIVPIGNALDFENEWDGTNIVQSLTRIIKLK